MLFSLNKNSDSTSQNKRFVKKIRFHYAKKLHSQAGIYTRKTRRKWFPTVGEMAL